MASSTILVALTGQRAGQLSLASANCIAQPSPECMLELINAGLFLEEGNCVTLSPSVCLT